MRVRFRHVPRTLTGAAVAVVLAAADVSCDKEAREFRVDPPSAATVATRRDLPPLPGTELRAPPGEMQSYRPVKHDYEANAYALSEGERLFNAFNCVGCHGHGGGGIGPALMDAAWIHGYRPEDVYATIVEGRPNGMPAFGGRIPNDQVWQLVAYVRSLSGLSASRDAAPGREDHMSAAPPPNSVTSEHPVASSTELEEFRRREAEDFARMGWRDPRTGEVRVPEAVVQKLGQDLARQPTSGPAPGPAATQPAATQPAAPTLMPGP